MYRTCPKCGHTPDADEPASAGACPACGVVYAKWLRSQLRAAGPGAGAPGRDGQDRSGGRWRALGDRLVHVEQRVNVFELGGRALVWVGLLAWTAWFFGTDHTVVEFGSVAIGESFMHRVNLVFHEAGHVLFMPFGEFMMVLGGSLGQLLMPAIVAVGFVVRHHNPFGGSVALWWLGQSAMDLAPYIADARAGRLLLLGGFTGQDRPGVHDWSRLLGRLGWLQHDHAIAAVVNGLGMALMSLALVWGAWLLRLQHRNRDRRF